MLKEVVYFFRHVPGVVWLSFQMSHADLFSLLMQRSDAAGGAAFRERLVEGLRGKVLEIGCGTGRMFQYYSRDVQLTAIEPSGSFIALAEKAAEASEAEITLEVAGGESLPYEDGAFDAVVLSAVLCSVQSPERVLLEARRVLRTGGNLRMIEHVRSERLLPGALMVLFNPLWRLYNHMGCNMHRRIDEPLRKADLDIEEDQTYQVFAPGLAPFPFRFIKAKKTRC